MVLAVLNVRYGINLADKEIYLNVAGGLKINEPAADLAMASALISASCNVACPNNCIIFGEIGLSGEIRSVNHTNIRLKEAVKLGFTRAIIPAKSKYLPIEGIDIKEISHIKELKDIYRR
jgi:DNA repair protein RadA/Sms